MSHSVLLGLHWRRIAVVYQTDGWQLVFFLTVALTSIPKMESESQYKIKPPPCDGVAVLIAIVETATRPEPAREADGRHRNTRHQSSRAAVVRF